MKDDT